VFPRLVASEHTQAPDGQTLLSGVPRLDMLLGGGLTRGTSTLVIGPAGCGKSSLTTQFALEAACEGQTAAVFMFDESVETYLMRSRGLGFEIDPHVESGRIQLRQVDSAELTPGEFAGAVRVAVEQDGAKVIVIDSLNGYLHAMPEQQLLLLHLHELLTYLGHKGVTTLMVMAQHGLIGNQMQSPIDTTYLADTVILLRYFESGGEVRRALSVIKKRTGAHERTIRELRLTSHGIDVGEPLREFQGILTGVPHVLDAKGQRPLEPV